MAIWQENKIVRDQKGRFAEKPGGKMNALLADALDTEDTPITDGMSSWDMGKWAEKNVGVGTARNSKDDPRKPTKQEERALQDYLDRGYEDINEMLRHGKVGFGGDKLETTEEIQQIDSLIDRYTLPETVEVVRTESPSAFGLPRNSYHAEDYDLKALEGQTFREDGYLSTSMRTEPATLLRKPIYMKIKVPKGNKAMYVAHEPGALSREQELMIERGAEIRINRADLIDDPNGTGVKKWMVEAELVGVNRKGMSEILAGD